MSLTLFVVALRYLGSARTGAYFSAVPFFGAMAAIRLLHEPLRAQLLLAGVLMAPGVWLHLTERHEHEHDKGHGIHIGIATSRSCIGIHTSRTCTEGTIIWRSAVSIYGQWRIARMMKMAPIASRRMVVVY
jgi:hypothetical protein